MHQGCFCFSVGQVWVNWDVNVKKDGDLGGWRAANCVFLTTPPPSRFSCRVSACSHSCETPPKEAKLWQSMRWLEERSSDTLLQQTSMMVKPASTVARAVGCPPALETPIPTVNP
jgi:hypothetical protein